MIANLWGGPFDGGHTEVADKAQYVLLPLPAAVVEALIDMDADEDNEVHPVMTTAYYERDDDAGLFRYVYRRSPAA